MNACGGCNGECEKGGGSAYCSLSTSTSTSSCSSNSPSSNPPPPSKIFKELSALVCLCWACDQFAQERKCRGLFPSRSPRRLEQAASVSSFPVLDIPTFDLQPQIFCKVIDVELLANKENDEVYTHTVGGNILLWSGCYKRCGAGDCEVCDRCCAEE